MLSLGSPRWKELAHGGPPDTDVAHLLSCFLSPPLRGSDCLEQIERAAMEEHRLYPVAYAVVPYLVEACRREGSPHNRHWLLQIVARAEALRHRSDAPPMSDDLAGDYEAALADAWRLAKTLLRQAERKDAYMPALLAATAVLGGFPREGMAFLEIAEGVAEDEGCPVCGTPVLPLGLDLFEQEQDTELPDFLDLGTLSLALQDRPSGPIPPYSSGDETAIESFLSEIATELAGLGAVKVIRETDHYGSGYASYVDLFLYRRDARPGPDHETAGLSVYLSRVYPCAAVGPNRATLGTGPDGPVVVVSRGVLAPEQAGEIPSFAWADLHRRIVETLESRGLHVLAKEILLARLPFRASVPTVLTDPPYRIFDAFFHWID